MKQQIHYSPTRSGSVLVIVAGLSALLLTMFLIVTRQVRNEVNDGALVARETQARFMLPAALCFILEAGRLGSEFDGEAFGWTDVRDGGVGPRGPRDSSGALPAEVAAGTWPGKGSVYRAPMRAWQRPPGAVKPYYCYNPIVVDPSWLEAYENADDPETTFLWKALNPDKVAGTTDFSEGSKYFKYQLIGQVPEYLGNTAHSSNHYNMWHEDAWTSDFWLPNEYGLQIHWSAVMDALYSPESFRMGDGFGEEYHFMLGPQPVSDTWADFAAGELTSSGNPRYRMDSMARAWFRIYRETASDHDGDGSPWYDTMRLEDSTNDIHNHGVFIVTCGAGATEGYRDWSEAGASGQFPSQDFFEKLRAQERILWFRVQWSPFVGGGADYIDSRYHLSSSHVFRSNGEYFAGSHGEGKHGLEMFYSNVLLQRDWNNDGSEDSNKTYGKSPNKQPHINNLGTISWIERLEKEPPTW